MSPAGVTSTFHGPKSRCSGTAGRAPRPPRIASPSRSRPRSTTPPNRRTNRASTGSTIASRQCDGRTRRLPRRERRQPVGDFPGPRAEAAAREQRFERAPDDRGLAHQRHAAGLPPDEQPRHAGDAAEAARRQARQRIALPPDAGGRFVHSRRLHGHQWHRARLGERQQHDLADAARPAGHRATSTALGRGTEPPARPPVAQPGRRSKLAGGRSARAPRERADRGPERPRSEIAGTPAGLREQAPHPAAAQALPRAHVRRRAPRAHGNPEYGRGSRSRPRPITGDILEPRRAERALDLARSADARVPLRIAGAARARAPREARPAWLRQGRLATTGRSRGPEPSVTTWSAMLATASARGPAARQSTRRGRGEGSRNRQSTSRRRAFSPARASQPAIAAAALPPLPRRRSA